MSDESLITPTQLAFLAGRGSLGVQAEREAAALQARVVNARAAPGVHPDPNGELFGMQEGDALLYDQRGGSTYAYGPEWEDE